MSHVCACTLIHSADTRVCACESGNRVREGGRSQTVQGCAGHVRALDFVLNEVESAGGFKTEEWPDLITLTILSRPSQI